MRFNRPVLAPEKKTLRNCDHYTKTGESWPTEEMLGLQSTCGGQEKLSKLAGPKKKNRGSAQPEATTAEIIRVHRYVTRKFPEVPKGVQKTKNPTKFDQHQEYDVRDGFP